MMKKICAVVELGQHYMLSLQSQILLSQKYTCFHYVIKGENKEDEILGSLIDNEVSVFKFNSLSSLLLKLKRDSKKIDIIFFQGFIDHHTNRNRFLIFIFLLFNRKKIVASIRNGFSYMPDKIQIYWKSYRTRGRSKIRNLITRILQYLRVQGNLIIYPMIKSYVFESKTQLTFFKHNINRIKDFKFGVIYDKYTILRENEKITETLNPEKKIIIGLLGGISINRRDYPLLIDSLQLLDKNILNKICFLILGNSLNEEAPEIIRNLKDVVETKVIKPYLTEDQFQYYGSMCSFLCSPLRDNKPCGTLTGTGGIGDFVALSRKMILPKRVDPLEEFSKFCLYFNNKTELASILRDIVVNNKSGNIKTEELYEFTKENVLKGLENEGIF